jgi:hypothetical protein
MTERNLLSNLLGQDRTEGREDESAHAEDVANQIVGKLKIAFLRLRTFC